MNALVEDKTLTARLVVTSRPLDCLLVFCGLVTAVLIAIGDSTSAVAAFKLVVWLTVPGWAVVRRLPVIDPAARVAWTGVIGASVAALAGLAMAWTGQWHPQPVAVAILVLATAYICFSPGGASPNRDHARWWPGARSRSFSDFVPWLILGLAAFMWVFALTITDTGPLDDLGLLSKFPAVWYVAVSLVFATCVWGVVARQVASTLMMSAAITLLVTILYGSAGLLTNVPRLPWTYKHIAVTDYIGAAGRVDPSLDIYNRWPGFFSASAFLGEVMGHPDALAYAAWAEPGFALVNVLLVLAVVRAISRKPRIYWTTVLVFVLANWVGQNYYSPQAFAYSLHLTICLTALTFLGATPIQPVRAIECWWMRRREQAVEIEKTRFVAGRLAGQVTATVAILVLQGIVAASHQLTPYIAVLGLLPLFGLGFFRPRWIGFALLAIPLIYLIPNWDYVTTTFGLFDGFSFFANATYRTEDQVPLTDVGRLQEAGIMVLSALVGILACLGYIRRFLNGEVRTTLIVSWLAISPLFVLLGQSYGGEGLIRIYLFALPWLAIGVAWFFWSGPIPMRRAPLMATASLAAMAFLFTGTYFQPELERRVSEDEVIAAKWLDAKVRPDDLIIEVNSGFPRFPLKIGPNYPIYETASLADLLKSPRNILSVSAIEKHLANDIPSTAKAYVVFSESQERWAIEKDRLDPAVFPRAERELSQDRVEKVVDEGTVRVYLLLREVESQPAAP
ncbi:hypothetical protein [Pseudarthrobacter sp. NamB4]|uniref:hypothetical protein n=1 Tax=Pseudarthrobacter sp. NamB4 TaxID=2576837 RepID=UPI0010FDB2A4|nr:hypothetical protein [Pseudarthrobacter sp. NamB4]TLM72143.1 hypothetical protein FDW81_14670 [Pseudarthrobacter sp. NamB4]